MASMASGLGASLLGGLAGLFSKPKPVVTTQSQHTDSDAWNRPVYDSNVLEMRNQLINKYLGQMQDEGDYWSGYARQGMGQLAQGGDASRRMIENLLAQRGIRGSAAGSALAMPAINQQMQQSSFLNSIPQLADQRRRAILGETGQFLQSLPYAQHQTSSSDMTGRSEQSGGQPNGLGSFLSGFAPTFGYMAGQGAFGKMKGAPVKTGPVGNDPTSW